MRISEYNRTINKQHIQAMDNNTDKSLRLLYIHACVLNRMRWDWYSYIDTQSEGQTGLMDPYVAQNA